MRRNPTATSLPVPSQEALESSALLTHRLQEEIIRSESDSDPHDPSAHMNLARGWIPFSRFMERSLYTPGLGYYTGGSVKLGSAGDFTTAPEMTPLFGRALAHTLASLLEVTAPRVLEVGAGSGRLAADILLELERMGQVPASYEILDLSGELVERQKKTLKRCCPHLTDRVRWRTILPDTFNGVVIGNEVLDAMPVNLVEWGRQGIVERGVGLGTCGEFVWSHRPVQGPVREMAERLRDDLCSPGGAWAEDPEVTGVMDGYLSELGVQAWYWITEWMKCIEQGAMLLVDYGFPRREYYHPERDRGTLMCHYRHHAHPDPFYLPGLQDITAHVDFTAVAEAACAAGGEVLGYTSQAAFLLDAGITQLLGECPADDPAYLAQAGAVNRLLSPAEMGELFKVIALGKGLPASIHGRVPGFRRGDRTGRL